MEELMRFVVSKEPEVNLIIGISLIFFVVIAFLLVRKLSEGTRE